MRNEETWLLFLLYLCGQGHITLLFRSMKHLKQIELWVDVHFSGKSSHNFHLNLKEIHIFSPSPAKQSNLHSLLTL